MDLSTKFQQATTEVLRIGAMGINKEYPNPRALRVVSVIGHSVMLYVKDTSSKKLYKLFLQKIYGCEFSDKYLERINNEEIWRFVTYKGISVNDNKHVFEIA